MRESILAILAMNLLFMTSVYWVCLIVGGGLLLISSLAGGDTDAGIDADVDVDLDVDADVDGGHVPSGSLASWFSMQFVVFFMAVFGVVGVVLTHLTDTGAAGALTTAMVAGLVVGQAVHQLMRKLRRSSGDSTPRVRDYVDKLARVTVTVTAVKKGEVVLRVGRADRYIPAISKHAETTFASGDQVAVVAYRDGVAEVVSREEYEFLTDRS